MYIFVFDVDGTLTPSKKEMDTDFKHFFKSFCLKNKVYIVTGNDLDQTEDQLGPDLIKTCEGIFTCGGNEYYSDGKKIYSNRFELTYHEKDIIETLLNRSFFTTRTGYHFEKKTGLVNFSVLGRNATNKQREEYIEWDKKTKERAYLVRKIRSLLPRLDCYIAGDLGIDIHLRGNDKGQIFPFITEDDKKIIFFGDKCNEDENDFHIAILSDQYYHVKSWQETEMILRMEYSVQYPQIKG